LRHRKRTHDLLRHLEGHAHLVTLKRDGSGEKSLVTFLGSVEGLFPRPS
jgi:hypothetical protein